MKKASITIETALILPFFFLAVVGLFYMLEVMDIRTNIRSGMQYAAKRAAEEVYVIPSVQSDQIEKDIVQAIGRERLERSIVEGGSEGLNCEESRVSVITGIVELKVRYKVRLPIPAFANAAASMEETMRVKGWCGYSRTGFGDEAGEIVFITENGIVYHRSEQCEYLDLSIRPVSAEDIDALRNKNQGKYYACEICAGEVSKGLIYITDYGERYHESLRCSGLKRTIYAVPLAEAVGKGACSKCGK